MKTQLTYCEKDSSINEFIFAIPASTLNKSAILPIILFLILTLIAIIEYAILGGIISSSIIYFFNIPAESQNIMIVYSMISMLILNILVGLLLAIFKFNNIEGSRAFKLFVGILETIYYIPFTLCIILTIFYYSYKYDFILFKASELPNSEEFIQNIYKNTFFLKSFSELNPTKIIEYRDISNDYNFFNKKFDIFLFKNTNLDVIANKSFLLQTTSLEYLTAEEVGSRNFMAKTNYIFIDTKRRRALVERKSD